MMDLTPARSVYYTASESGDPETPYPYQTPRTNWGSSMAGTTPRAQGWTDAFIGHLEEPPSDDSTIVITPRVAHWALPFPKPRGQPASEDSTITARRYVSAPISMNIIAPTRSSLGLAQGVTSSPTHSHSLLRSVSSTSPLDGSPLIPEVMLRDCAIGDTGYSAKLYTAVDRVASSLAARGRTKETNAMRALYDQSFKDPGSADLLDAIIRRRTSERQKLDFRRYAEDVSKVGNLDESGQSGHNVVEITAVKKRKRMSTAVLEPVVIIPSRTEPRNPVVTSANALAEGYEMQGSVNLEEEPGDDDEPAMESVPLEEPLKEPLKEMSVPSGAILKSPVITEQSLPQQSQDKPRIPSKKASRRHRRGKKRQTKELDRSVVSFAPHREGHKARVVQHKPILIASRSQAWTKMPNDVTLLVETQEKEQMQSFGRRRSKHQYRMFHGANGPVYSINLLEGQGHKKQRE